VDGDDIAHTQRVEVGDDNRGVERVEHMDQPRRDPTNELRLGHYGVVVVQDRGINIELERADPTCTFLRFGGFQVNDTWSSGSRTTTPAVGLALHAECPTASQIGRNARS
jgi:hypothetical protein